jgi:large subunit ribosomal protein L25
MAEQPTIAADVREGTGTGAARAARRAGKVPGIVYGAGRDNIMIQLDRDMLNREYIKAGFFNHLYKLKVGKDSMDVLARDIQLHPVSDVIMHVDFLAVKANAQISVAVPVHFINEEDCKGLRRGGVLNIVRHEVEVNCPANAIPEQIVVDLSGLDIGDSVHVSMVSLGDGVTPVIDDRDFTIATIAPPTVIADVTEDEGEGEAGDEESGEDEGEKEED